MEVFNRLPSHVTVGEINMRPSLISGLVILGLAGCATDPCPRLISTPVREDPGGIALSAGGVPLAIQHQALGKSAATRQGAKSGALAAISAAGPSPEMGAVAILLLPITTGGGALYGAVAGQSAADLAAQQTATANVRTELVFHDDLSGAVLKASLTNPTHRYFFLTDQTCPGVTSRLNILVTAYELSGEKAVNPVMKLHVRMTATLTHLDGREIAHGFFDHFSKPKRYTQWAAHNAAALREAHAAAVSTLSDDLVKWLAGNFTPPPIIVHRHKTALAGR